MKPVSLAAWNKKSTLWLSLASANLVEGQGSNELSGMGGDSSVQPGSPQPAIQSGLRMNTTMVSPFDLKTALLAKHAQHVVLIHFPIAPFIAAVAFATMAT